MDQQTRETLIRLGTPTIDDPVAELILDIEFSDGHRETQHCRIGCPENIDGFHVCPVQGIGPIRLPSPGVGDSSFQALNIAIHGIKHTLHSFVERHTCRLILDGNEISLTWLDRVLFAHGDLADGVHSTSEP